MEAEVTNLETLVENAEAAQTEEATPVEATDTDSEPKTEDVKPVEVSKDEEPKKTHDQRRWERLLNERAEYKAKLDLLEQQQRTQQTQAKPNSTRPAREKFADDESYVDALTDWKLEQKFEPYQRKVAEQAQQAQIEAQWDVKIAAAKKEYSDFEDVLNDSQNVPVSAPMAQAIKTSDIGADLVYFLGKDPEYATKISKMDPLSAAREIGRIESYIEYEKNQKKEKPVSVSKAPPPIKPVKSSSTGSTKSLEDMTPAEYMAFRNKQVGKRK